MLLKDITNSIEYVELYFNTDYFEIAYKGDIANLPEELKSSKIISYKIEDNKLYAVINS